MQTRTSRTLENMPMIMNGPLSDGRPAVLTAYATGFAGAVTRVLRTRWFLVLSLVSGLALAGCNGPFPPCTPGKVEASDSAAAAPEAATGQQASIAVRAQRHMIVAANPLAAEAGREILRQGGSAVDAAIAT